MIRNPKLKTIDTFKNSIPRAELFNTIKRLDEQVVNIQLHPFLNLYNYGKLQLKKLAYLG